MRRIFFLSCILVALLVIVTGCLQAPAASPAPVPAPTSPPSVSVTLPPAVAATTGLEKNVTFTVTSSGNAVNVTCTGGPDASSLVSITIQITNYDGTRVGPRTIQNPTIGSTYVFTYRGPANPELVNIIGNFNDGTQQTVLMQYF